MIWAVDAVRPPPTITYSDYCERLVIDEAVNNWTLKDGTHFGQCLSDNSGLRSLFPKDSKLFIITPSGYWQNGELLCDYTVLFLNSKITLKCLSAKPSDKSIPKESGKDFERRKKQWCHDIVKALLTQGNDEMNDENYVKALAYFEEILKHEPHNTAAKKGQKKAQQKSDDLTAHLYSDLNAPLIEASPPRRHWLRRLFCCCG